MKVTLLKPHLGKKAGTTVEATDEQATYMERVGLIKGSTENKVAEPAKRKKVSNEKKATKQPATITTKSVKNLPAKKKR